MLHPLPGARPAATSHGGHAHDFERFLKRYETANTAFVNGDVSAWLSLTAGKDPVSIFGGFGGLGDAGLASVHQRYLLAGTAFQSSGAKVEFQYLVKDVQGRLAYTVAIERTHVLYAGQTERRPQILRVTMLFRRDHGDWKIVHRHADTMIALQLRNIRCSTPHARPSPKTHVPASAPSSSRPAGCAPASRPPRASSRLSSRLPRCPTRRRGPRQTAPRPQPSTRGLRGIPACSRAGRGARSARSRSDTYAPTGPRSGSSRAVAA